MDAANTASCSSKSGPSQHVQLHWRAQGFIHQSLHTSLEAWLRMDLASVATHSSILAWRIPWTEEPGGLQSTGSQRVGHDWVTSLSLYIIQSEHHEQTSKYFYVMSQGVYFCFCFVLVLSLFLSLINTFNLSVWQDRPWDYFCVWHLNTISM